jgi:catechol 2,3-dioxygenase-like lactoylglutathione lyase family enzyme
VRPLEIALQAGESMPMPAPVLGHVNIRTTRMEDTLAFYETLLGFRRGVAATNPDPSVNMWLHDGEGRASIHVNLVLAGEPPRDGMSALDHIAFNCSDMALFEARLRAMTVPYRVAPTRVPQLVQLVLADPNGIKVELTFGHEAVAGLFQPV